jgi:hypothetical protein
VKEKTTMSARYKRHQQGVLRKYTYSKRRWLRWSLWKAKGGTSLGNSSRKRNAPHNLFTYPFAPPTASSFAPRAPSTLGGDTLDKLLIRFEI